MQKISNMDTAMDKIAVWVLTSNGLKISEKLNAYLESIDLFVSKKIKCELRGVFKFESLRDCVRDNFTKYSGHIFIMSTGITVRVISDLIESKTKDPAVLVIDDRALNVISLLSGHIGGANKLCIEIAKILDSNPVITTATDVNKLPAIDVISVENDLAIENPVGIKKINSLILRGEVIKIFDPFNLITSHLDGINLVNDSVEPDLVVDYHEKKYGSCPLILRPKVLSAGIGCNRGTDVSEIRELLIETLKKNDLSFLSLKSISTIDIKMDETGILKLAEEINLPVEYFDKNELNSVENITAPSLMALKHVGVKSVCEAAAIMSTKGKLLIPKRKTKNVTIAIAKNSISLE
jgi:cobalt-precorrin 5A hydrolase